MTQPKIEDVGHGKPIMPFGSDGTDWYALLIDTLGHLQVDVVSAALGTGGATEATLLLIKGYVDALETLLAGGLPAALDSGALKTKEQSPLTGFATSANQTTMITALQLIDDLRNALGSVATDELDVHVEGFDPVPSSPVCKYSGDVVITTNHDTLVISHTVTADKIFYLTDFVLSEVTAAAGVEFYGYIMVDATVIFLARGPAGNHVHISLKTPIKCTSGQVVALYGFQFSGVDKTYRGMLTGFEV